jgi:hypothetical protein
MQWVCAPDRNIRRIVQSIKGADRFIHGISRPVRTYTTHRFPPGMHVQRTFQLSIDVEYTQVCIVPKVM